MSQTTRSFFFSSLTKKYLMGLTGLFLCLFLVGHLSGNLQLLKGGYAGKLAFNEYAVFMTTFPAVKILSWLTYISILVHSVDGIALAIANRKARPVKYAYSKPGTNSSWASRAMAPLGLITLIFIVMHMSQFWAEYHWAGGIPVMQTEAGDGYVLKDGTNVKGGELDGFTVYLNGEKMGPVMKDLHEVVIQAYKDPWVVFFYVVGLIVIAFHLSHGFASGFQSLGLNHPVYTPIIKKLGFLFAVVVPLGFAIIPIALALGKTF